MVGTRVLGSICGLVFCGAVAAGCSRGDPEPSFGETRARTQALGETPDRLVFDLEVEGTPLRLVLRRIDAPVSAEYATFRLGDDGRFEAVTSTVPGCLYTGTVHDPRDDRKLDGSFVSVSTCLHTAGHPPGETLHGLVSTPEQLWSITPLPARSSNGALHEIVPVSAVQARRAREFAESVSVRRTLVSLSPTIPLYEGTPRETKYVELFAVSDEARQGVFGDSASTSAATAETVAQINALYAASGLEPRVRVVLTGQLLFAPDPFAPVDIGGGEVSSEDLLTSFNAWATTADLPHHDLHLLLSGFDFDSITAGLAPGGGMCLPGESGVIVESTAEALPSVALAAAHEIGHTLSFQHDGEANTCPDSGFIMSAIYDPTTAAPTTFSTCSQSEFDDYLSYGGLGAECLSNVPVLVANDVCGDGVVSGAETCDCGASDCAGFDPCCDGSTCRLVAEAECSSFGEATPCCIDCRMAQKEDALTCRPARDACDTPEVCSGFSFDCPGDVFAPAGTDCFNDSGEPGACFAGSCVARGDLCRALGPAFASEFTAPDAACLFGNENCADVICDDVAFGCSALGGFSPEDGTICGLGMQCQGGACVLSTALDECPEDDAKTAPGACGCGVADTDGDDDSEPDCSDFCPEDPDKTEPGVCGCGVADGDSDGDETHDCDDGCPGDPEKTEPGDCGCGEPDTDGDGDRTADCDDGCPADAEKTEPGDCGCGNPETDSDSDGVPDCIDAAPEDPDVGDPGSPSGGEGAGAGDDGGCGCRVSASSSANGGAYVWGLALVVAVGRRRRSHSSRGRVTRPR